MYLEEKKNAKIITETIHHKLQLQLTIQYLP